MFFKLALLFIVIPFIELAILIKLGSEIGFWDTILIVIFTGLLGAALARWQGLTIWQNIQQELQLTPQKFQPTLPCDPRVSNTPDTTEILMVDLVLHLVFSIFPRLARTR